MSAPDVILESAAARLVRMPAARYHADPCDVPSLSASVAKELVQKSPLHAWLRHPKFGAVRKEPTADMERGTVIHGLVFGDAPELVVIDAPDYRTSAAQQRRNAAHDAGKVPILGRKLAEYRAVAAGIKDGLDEIGIDLSCGESEAVALWTEETPFGAVQCRGKLDHVDFLGGRAAIIDLKTCESASPLRLPRHVVDLGYDIQRAAYVSAVEKLRPDLAGRVDYLWVFAEEVALLPPVLTLARATGTMRELGERRWNRACATWAKCLAANEWPGYADGAVDIEATPWQLAEEGIV